MRKARYGALGLMLVFGILFTGCNAGGGRPVGVASGSDGNSLSSVSLDDMQNAACQTPELSAGNILQLEDGFAAARFEGNFGFPDFLEQGGASSDREVAAFLAGFLPQLEEQSDLTGGAFGCSTLAAATPEGDVLFGRNFDWETCSALVVEAHPEDGYASISTVNIDFIVQSTGGALDAGSGMDPVKILAALYAPLDGMNEAGLAVSVNMIQDRATIDQNTGRPDLTTTTAVRLLLDKAANVDEALSLLEQHDLHASMGYMIHFALADADGRSVVVEYVDNEMTVTETPVVTNFYLSEGKKYGIGTQQSHERYDILTQLLSTSPAMTAEEMRDALDSVSKDNFGEFESTEWSIVMNLTTDEACYYHRENYGQGYLFRLEKEEDAG